MPTKRARKPTPATKFRNLATEAEAWARKAAHPLPDRAREAWRAAHYWNLAGSRTKAGTAMRMGNRLWARAQRAGSRLRRPR